MRDVVALITIGVGSLGVRATVRLRRDIVDGPEDEMGASVGWFWVNGEAGSRGECSLARRGRAGGSWCILERERSLFRRKLFGVGFELGGIGFHRRKGGPGRRSDIATVKCIIVIV